MSKENENEKFEDDIEVIFDEDDEFFVDDKKKKSKNEMTPEQKKAAIRKEAFSWIRLIIIAVAIALFINFVILFNGRVPSGSMYPTIEATEEQGARIIGLRLSYLFSEPERGDIIIFKYPDNPNENYVKRLIGLPGETVEIKDGKVYIYDKDGNLIEDPLDEPYLNEEPRLEDYGPYKVPENSYFMMGDNRNNSWDSRKWKNTYVPKEYIVGKALFQYWPNVHSLLDKYY